jgi:hypothetical protein
MPLDSVCKRDAPKNRRYYFDFKTVFKEYSRDKVYGLRVALLVEEVGLLPVDEAQPNDFVVARFALKS